MQQQYPPPPGGQGMIIGQPAFGVANPTDYNTGLCDCFSDPTVCLEGWCCPYCQMAHQSNMAETGNPTMDIGVCCISFIVDAVCTAGLALAFMTCQVRSKLQQRYHLRHAGCADCLQSFCCPLCTICQQHREMTLRYEWPGGVCVKPPVNQPMGGGGQAVVAAAYPVQQGQPGQGQQGQYPPPQVVQVQPQKSV